MPVVYALSHVPPEVSAYGMAKYSRSDASMRHSLLELSQQSAEAFLNTFYFSYGHASIADLAHVPLAIEQISLLAAMDIVDEPLWDGQERSTRYQDFRESPYYTPENASAAYGEAVASLFSHYLDLLTEAESALRERYTRPESLKPGAYRRTIKARAFDLARYALPLAALTSLGQVTNARVLERQIRRLMASPFEEVRSVAAAMKAAVTLEKPFNLLEARLAHLGIPIPDAILNEMNPGPIAPTLTKYTDLDAYRLARRRILTPVVAEFFAGQSTSHEPVTLHTLANPLEDLLAGLIYGESLLSYGEIVQRLQTLSSSQKEEILGEVLQARGPYDAWPPEMHQRPLIFDITLDVGAFRDLNRHRRLDKIVQRLDPQLGYETPVEYSELGIGHHFHAAMDRHYARIMGHPADERVYLLPLAHQRRVLFRMDFAEAAYLIELRSRSSGHFSYRRIANHLYRAIETAYPSLAGAIKVTPMEAFDPFER